MTAVSAKTPYREAGLGTGPLHKQEVKRIIPIFKGKKILKFFKKRVDVSNGEA